MREDRPERYSQAENRPDVLDDMLALLESGREKFEQLRTKPAPGVVP